MYTLDAFYSSLACLYDAIELVVVTCIKHIVLTLCDSHIYIIYIYSC